MELQELNDDYWITELTVVEWSEDYAAIHAHEHQALAAFLYGDEPDYAPVVHIDSRPGYEVLAPEYSMPSDTIAVPADDPGMTSEKRTVMVVRQRKMERLENGL